MSLSSPTALVPAIRSGNLFVALCADDRIRIVCRRSIDATQFLNARGYEFRPLPEFYADCEGCYFVLPVLNDAAKAVELMGLRDHGIPFSIGREWNPCEVFEYLREQNLAEGGYWSVGNFWPHGFDVRWNE